ncbi:polymerase 2 [Seminavis robusta]|uniref:Poly [ADP-ribose] polymerase n=1 Tax=Seminavis robusta TaxID=568900 RepID=A0A9N8E3V6_9STRA|nr:polymerase 2 [Seminavis robusta]|eukprot:Sro633_g178800.1 polymerase 2 (889) ;mRNA; r:20026-22692
MAALYLEHSSGTKFWRFEWEGDTDVKISYGKVGSAGRTMTKSFASADEAQNYAEKQEAAKRKGGYDDAEDPNDPTTETTTTPTKAKQAKSVTPSPPKVAKTRGLGGYAAPEPHKIHQVDDGVAGIDAALASRAQVHDTLHARLALVDPSINSDKYYVLQVLVEEHPNKKAKSNSKTTKTSASQYHVFTRWGRTGTGGQCKMAGPFCDLDDAESEFAKIFKSKTGVVWEKAVPGRQPLTGKYEYLATKKTSTDSSDDDEDDGDGTWFYYLQNDPDGKSDGWYQYDKKNSAEVEDLFGTYVASNKPARLSRRVVTSGSSGFQYRVDLNAMTQTNTSSGTTRPIARTVDGHFPISLPPPPNKKKAAPKKKVVATSAKKPAAKATTKKASPQKKAPPPASASSVAATGGVGTVDDAASSGLKSCGKIYQDYNVMLNQTNLDHNNNKFYKIQLIESSSGNNYTVFTKWGRVGEAGKTQEQGPFADVDAGIKEFAKKFRSKTANKWEDYQEDKDSFQSKTGKYTVVEMEQDAAAAAAMVENVGAAKTFLPCQLDATTKELVDLIFNEDMFKSAMSQMKLDPKKLPLGALSQTQISKGFTVLEKLEEEIDNGATGATLSQLTSEFYTLIPHAFGRSRGPVLKTTEAVQAKYEMLNTLADIEAAQTMQRNVQSAAGDEDTQPHPSDANYQQLAADLTLLDPDKDDDHQLIESYFADTKAGAMKLRQVWRVDRHKEENRFAQHAKLTNRKLLWHGTNVAVVAAILKSGLRIMPHSGGRVGKGIYLADQHQKSAWYVSGAQGTILMFLVEAALGKEHEILTDDPSLTAAPTGYDSVLAKGRTQPPEEAELEIDGKSVTVPQGIPKAVPAAKSSAFDHNEFLVYKESQHRIRYILAFDG